jgi:hypothetical protein
MTLSEFPLYSYKRYASLIVLLMAIAPILSTWKGLNNPAKEKNSADTDSDFLSPSIDQIDENRPIYKIPIHRISTKIYQILKPRNTCDPVGPPLNRAPSDFPRPSRPAPVTRRLPPSLPSLMATLKKKSLMATQLRTSRRTPRT